MSGQDFKEFEEIKQLDKTPMIITQKLHGSNASIYIYKTESGSLDLKVGCRTRWITPDKDNYGFATFVYENKQEFLDKLGEGRYFGEWVGPGINSAEGFKEKHLVLFNHWNFPPERPLPPRTLIVPVLYKGSLDSNKVREVMDSLKTNGSALVPGYMNVEGIVVTIGGHRYKKVFNAEETAWKPKDGKSGVKSERVEQISKIAVDHLLQPIRLEKLLSRDETYIKNYPASLPNVMKAYVADLIKEEQLVGDEDTIKLTRKALGSKLFQFINSELEKIRKLSI